MSVATLRLLPAPDCGPPYDDELPHAVALPTAPVRLVPTPLRLVPPVEEPDEGLLGPRTALDRLPDPEPVVRALVQRLLEVQGGLRPLRQLEPATSLPLFARLEEQLARPGEGGRLRSVQVQTRPEGVAEACATVVRRTASGPRVQALALRLEGRGGRWCCTELEGLQAPRGRR